MAIGKVYLVGAGPGDPALVSLRAVEVLGRADVVLFDYLANPAILAHCRPDAVRVSLGKHGGGRLYTQNEINDRLVASAIEGKTVVRLKSGDPMVFGRAAEELDCLVQHAIPFEIVPGVTAAFAAASYAGVPITNRDTASAVALITGQEGPDKPESALDYAALARFPGTLVFYMGVTTVARWSQALIAAGKPADTPVTVLRRVSLPDQRRLDATLGSVADQVQEAKLRPPVVFLVGDARRPGKTWSWFDKRPLFGQSVLVTRPEQQAVDLAAPLAELGAEVLLQPAIEIRPPQSQIDVSTQPGAQSSGDWAMVDKVIESLDQFNWIVFSSANGVRYFLGRLPAAGRDLRALGRVQIAAVGPGTAEELARYHLRADLLPDEFRAESLAAALSGDAAGRRFLLVRASRGREVLADDLRKAGGSVTQVVAYESTDVERPDGEIAARMAAGRIDWTTVTSSAIARSLANLFGDSLRNTRLVSISPITSTTLRERGFEPAAEAAEYTMAGLISALQDAAARISREP